MTLHSLSGMTVCIVDHDLDARAGLADELGRNKIATLGAKNSLQLFGLLKQQHIACILMAGELQEESGAYVQSEMRKLFVDAPPVIMLGKLNDRRSVVRAFRTGATDFLFRDQLRPGELMRSLRFAIDRRHNEDLFKAEFENLRRRSSYDAQTGLYNRQALENMVAKLAAPETEAKSFAVILIHNVQHAFVVETLGQVAGQRLNRAFASRLRGAMRAVDISGRYDENTFMCLVDSAATAEAAHDIIHRLDAALRFDLDLGEISLAMSARFGLAVYPEHGRDPVALMQVADMALERAATSRHASPERWDDDAREVLRVGNRRASPRRRVCKPGRIVSNGGSLVLDCLVRDISDTGARLRLPGIFGVPSAFELDLAGLDSRRPASIVWQRAHELGVRFAAPFPLPAEAHALGWN